MRSCDATVYCDSQSDSICHFAWCKSLTLQLAKVLHTEPPLCFTVGVIQGLQPFLQLFAAHRPSYLTKRFRTLIQQSKGLYSSALLFSLCVPWLTGAF